MAKTQSTKSKSGKDAATEKPLNGTKAGRVVKPSDTPKAKSKDIAKSVATAALNGKKDKVSKKARAPTPSDSGVSDSSSSEEEEDDSSSESESEAETKTVPSTNGAPKKAVKDESSDESSSDSESDEEEVSAKAVKPANVKGTVTPSTDADDTSDSESEASESSDSSDESDEESAKPKVNGTKINGAAKKDAGSESDDSEDDSEDSSDSSEDEESKEEESVSKKRKADETTVTPAKKTRTENGEAPKKNLFVGNLSWNVDEEWLRREFEGFGEISGCRIVTDRDSGRSKGFGYVEFEDAASAEQAHQEKNQQELDGRPMNIDFAVPRPEQSPFQKRERANQRADQFGDRQKNPPSATLFVGNLSFDCTADILSEAFSEFGTITRTSLPTDPESGSIKGYGYVGYSSVEEAQAALDGMTGQSIAGRTVRLDFATARPDRGDGGGRGGRGGFGNRGGRGGFGDRGGRGGFGGRGGRGGGRGGRGGSYNRGGFGDFKGSRVAFD